MKLTDSEPEEFKNALLDAYPSQSELERMVYYKLKKRLSIIAGGEDLEDIIFQLIVKAEAKGWIEQLVFAAYEYNSENELLKKFYHKYSKKHGLIAAKAISEGAAQGLQQPSIIETRRNRGRSSKTTTLLHGDKTNTSGSTSSNKILVQANEYIRKAQQCLLEAAAPFLEMDEDDLIPIQYKEAVKLLKQTNERMKNLAISVDSTALLPKIVALNHQQIIDKIDFIIEQIDELISSIEDEDPQLQEAREKFDTLEQNLKQLDSLFKHILR